MRSTGLVVVPRTSVVERPERGLGAVFDEARSEHGEVLGHVRTLRLLTDEKASQVSAEGWDALRGTEGTSMRSSLRERVPARSEAGVTALFTDDSGALVLEED